MATFPRHIPTTKRTLKPRAQRPQPEPDLILNEAVERHRTLFQLLNRDGNRCYICQRRPMGHELHIDHIIPKVAGGTDHPNNLAISCRTCNGRKQDHYISFSVADRTPELWIR